MRETETDIETDKRPREWVIGLHLIKLKNEILFRVKGIKSGVCVHIIIVIYVNHMCNKCICLYMCMKLSAY